MRQFDLEEYRNDLGQLIKDLHRETGLDPEGIRLRIEYIEDKSGFSFED